MSSSDMLGALDGVSAPLPLSLRAGEGMLLGVFGDLRAENSRASLPLRPALAARLKLSSCASRAHAQCRTVVQSRRHSQEAGATSGLCVASRRSSCARSLVVAGQLSDPLCAVVSVR